MTDQDHKNLKTKWNPKGYYQLDPIPTEEELSQYYAEIYYQDNRGQYFPSYTDDELNWFKIEGKISHHIFCELLPNVAAPTLFDVGCGEGFFSIEFLNAGWIVKSCDLSAFGIQKYNSRLLPYFHQGNIYEVLDKTIEAQESFDFVNLGYVLEHVREPEELISKIKRVVKANGLIRVAVPNDYSSLQALIKNNNKIDCEYWVCRDHINYFNFTTFREFLIRNGCNVAKYIADFPIEHFLLNDHSNYYRERSLGKQAHFARVQLDLFYSQNIDAYVRLLEAQAAVGMGRDIIAYILT